MLKKFLSAAVVFAAATAFAADANVIQLPKPAVTSNMTLKEALQLRQTNRNFAARPFTARQISDLLWCANGINRANGKRTTPAARGIYAVSLYVLTEKGAFKHDLQNNVLHRVSAEDLRWTSDGRKMGSKAPLVVVMVANGTAFGKLNQASATYIGVEAGAIMQNIYLYCAAAKMNTVVCGSFNRKVLPKALKLAKNEYIVLTQVVGFAE